jgi:hypothetical protein
MKDIETIKKDFIHLFAQRKNIDIEIQKMNGYLAITRNIYNQYVSKYSQSPENINGLDSIFFQYRLLNLDYAHLTAIYKNIDNNMYCEYYKLVGIIKQYIITDMKEKKLQDIILSKNYPKYKSFEYTKKYEIGLVFDMHHAIISIITELVQILKTRTDLVDSCKKHGEDGVNLFQLIHVQTYNNNLINSKIEMFLNWVDTITSTHNYYFENILSKLKLSNTTAVISGIARISETPL